MQNFSPNVNPALVKATFKRMAQVSGKQSLGTRKQRIANAVRAGAGSQLNNVDDDFDVFDCGITLDQFTKWAATVFTNCDASEFIEGIAEMAKSDGSDIRRGEASHGAREEEEEEEEDEEDEEPSCGPVRTLDIQEIWEKVDLQQALSEMLSESRYSICRSLKGRQLAMDMIVSCKLHFTHIASQIEHRRRVLTKETNPLVISDAWPPQNAEGERVARRVLIHVFDSQDATAFAEAMRKRLIMEYIPQVNRDSYATSTLKDQMQALVLASCQLLVDMTSEQAYQILLNAYDFGH